MKIRDAKLPAYGLLYGSGTTEFRYSGGLSENCIQLFVPAVTFARHLFLFFVKKIYIAFAKTINLRHF
ncbi:hypothetical protein GCM10011501_17640 [Thalassotalea profundi]|uniref:Uncharacterized protein n=1 Tax=Thalassotalea profundi TaxID=2036687 RepID=A0ABQ3IQD2_9GAMM|nr:hypothetical protein GCM10011501_17640 [Thalassotalea profundi]